MIADAFLSGLSEIVGAQYVLTSDADLAPYLNDWRGRYQGRAWAAVRPSDKSELAAVAAYCYANGVPMVPQGGNTGLVGGGIPDQSGRSVVISLSRLNRIRDLDVVNNTLALEAGCLLAQAQQTAAEADRLFPLSLASEGSCQIGGNISTNAGGIHVLRYGTMRDLVLGLEVVLPDGRIWDGMRVLRKDNTGYDLKQLFIGAEGTLGIVTAAVLKLFPRPRTRQVAWLSAAHAHALLAVLERLQSRCGERLNAFECVARPVLDLVLKHIPATTDPFPRSAQWYALIELVDTHGDAPLTELLEDSLSPLLDDGTVQDVALANNEAQAQSLWALRENASEAQRLEGVSIKHDISLPVSRIAEFVETTNALLSLKYPGVRVVTFGHMGDGNLHYNLSKATRTDNTVFITQTPEINRIVHDQVHAFGGSISAEHGLGQLKREEVRRYKSGIEMSLMQAVKQSFDPRNLMNPGKLL